MELNVAVTVGAPGANCPAGGVPAESVGSSNVVVRVPTRLLPEGDMVTVPITWVPTLNVTDTAAFGTHVLTPPAMVAVNVTWSLYCALAGLTVTEETVGAAFTVTVNEHVLEFPAASFTV